MAILKFLRKPKQKLIAKIIAWSLAVIPFVFLIYDRFIADKHPQLYLDVLTSASVLDIREDLPALDILFDGIDIRQQNLSLRIMSIKIINDSSKDILKGQYDQEDPVGLAVSTGKIIKADLVDTSNEYLKKNLSFRLASENKVYFKDVILDAHQFYTVKLLVLHPVGQMPSISSVGYIAGMKLIKVQETYKEAGKPSIWSRALAGSWSVQTVRFVTFFLIFGVLLFIAAGLATLVESTEKAKRKKHVRNFKATSELALELRDEFIFSRYVEAGYHELMIIKSIIQDNKSLTHYVNRTEETRGNSDLSHYSKVASRAKVVSLEFSVLGLMDELTRSGLIKIEEGIPGVDTHLKETLMQFLAYLKDYRLINKKDLEGENFVITEKLPL